MKKNSIAIIAALTENRVIGNENDLPWKHGSLSGYDAGPSDFDLFKQNTKGKPLIMFKNTWNSLPFKPLPKRPNIVISRNIEDITEEHPLLTKTTSLEKGIEIAKKNYKGEIMLIGGAKQYELALSKNLPNRLYLSHVKGEFEGDTKFPKLDFNNDWNLTKEIDCNQFIYRVWDRK